jgi:hypothetical protein
LPHFTLQILPEGPILAAFVGVSQPRGMALKAAGQTVPTPVQIRGLVDTGASCTCVDPSVLTQLNLTPTGKTQMITPSTGPTPHEADQYDIALIIPCTTGPLIVPTVAVVESDLAAQQGFHALIGRDILRRCMLTYNGDTGLFTLAY